MEVFESSFAGDASYSSLCEGLRWNGAQCSCQAGNPRESFFYYKSEELQAVRSGRWKPFLPHSNGNQTVPLALYDLKADIGEKNDLSASLPSNAGRTSATPSPESRAGTGDSRGESARSVQYRKAALR